MARHCTDAQSTTTDRAQSRVKTWLGGILASVILLAIVLTIRGLTGQESVQADTPRPTSARTTLRDVIAEPEAEPGVPAPMPAPPTAAPLPGTRATKDGTARDRLPSAMPSPPTAPGAGGKSGTSSGGKSTAKKEEPSGPRPAAIVNGETITREEAARQCLRYHGKDVLEGMINRYLIAEECKRRGITVTRDEVDAEIERMSRRFNLSVEHWMKLLKQERGITPLQYAGDVIWPTLALRKLAGDKLNISKPELQQAFEANYGPAIRCRMIALHDKRKAEEVRALAAASPADFPDLAKKHSEDPSASAKGLIQPIRRGTGFEEIENAAFKLRDGEISAVIPAGGNYVILKRETVLQPVRQVKYEDVAPRLEELVREKKLRGVAGEVFQQLQRNSKVENILNDPVRSKALPGVAATINNVPITTREVAEQCLDRHGEAVVDAMIRHKLVEQACKKRGITVSNLELDAEIARAAAVSLPPKADGTPDVAAWLKTVTEMQGMPIDVYQNDIVWPSAAMRKLVERDVKVTEEDLQKGFEANYGPRVRCRAIVLNNLRRAQEVWELARKKPTVENFGALAEQYSVEPGSQALRGEVPPICKHHGQPLLEKEAFSLKKGELSGIIQIGETYVILLCEGHTEPVEVAMADVRQDLYKDIYEKRLQQAMGDYFERLEGEATIDNYIAGKTQSPKDREEAKAAAAAEKGGPRKPATSVRASEVRAADAARRTPPR